MVNRSLRVWIRFLLWVAFGLSIYVLYAHVALPAVLRHYEHQPALSHVPKTTSDVQGRPADPLNVGLLGKGDELVTALRLAGWRDGDPKTARMRLYGRRPDLSFEKPVDAGARQRHHVRFWKLEQPSGAGRPTWLGTASHEKGGDVAQPKGSPARHAAADVDYTRDRLIADLSAAGQVVLIYQVTGVGARLLGRTGGGDRYFTDGELSVAVISEGNVRQTTAPDSLPNPKPVVIKGRIWSAARSLFGAAGTTGL
jgi:hypothetical protein